MFFTQIFDSTFSQSATFFFYPLVYIGVEMGTKSKKSAKKWSIHNKEHQIWNPDITKSNKNNHHKDIRLDHIVSSKNNRHDFVAWSIQEREEKSATLFPQWNTLEGGLILPSKKSLFLARTWHARAFPGICTFLLLQPSHTSAEKRHFFDWKKRKSDIAVR